MTNLFSKLGNMPSTVWKRNVLLILTLCSLENNLWISALKRKLQELVTNNQQDMLSIKSPSNMTLMQMLLHSSLYDVITADNLHPLIS